eukprot:4784789-Pleurochrysis_carterae.AAC.2
MRELLSDSQLGEYLRQTNPSLMQSTCYSFDSTLSPPRRQASLRLTQLGSPSSSVSELNNAQASTEQPSVAEELPPSEHQSDQALLREIVQLYRGVQSPAEDGSENHLADRSKGAIDLLFARANMVTAQKMQLAEQNITLAQLGDATALMSISCLAAQRVTRDTLTMVEEVCSKFHHATFTPTPRLQLVSLSAAPSAFPAFSTLFTYIGGPLTAHYLRAERFADAANTSSVMMRVVDLESRTNTADNGVCSADQHKTKTHRLSKEAMGFLREAHAEL